MAQERLEQDFGIIQACAGDVWRLCSDVLPDIGRMKECMQNKIGQLPRPCLDKLLDAMAGSSFKVCKDQASVSWVCTVTAIKASGIPPLPKSCSLPGASLPRY